MRDFAFPKGDREAHAELAGAMVRTVGVDLGNRAPDGQVTAPSLGTIVTRCQQCANPGSCQAWLRDHSEGAERAPDYCLNRDLFDDMPKRD